MARKSSVDEYEYTTTVQRNGNFISTIHRPILPPEERERRMKEIKKAAENFLRAYYTEQAKRERQALSKN